MNDFTKNELKIIYLNLCDNEKTKDVLIKVGSMFINYCEHELECLIISCKENDSILKMGITGDMDFKCKKCGKSYHDNQ